MVHSPPEGELGLDPAQERCLAVAPRRYEPCVVTLVGQGDQRGSLAVPVDHFVWGDGVGHLEGVVVGGHSASLFRWLGLASLWLYFRRYLARDFEVNGSESRDRADPLAVPTWLHAGGRS